jgi:hypothetical protein
MTYYSIKNASRHEQWLVLIIPGTLEAKIGEPQFGANQAKS